MHTFVSGVKRIIQYDVEGVNEKIKSKLPDIEKALDGIGYNIDAVFIHTGNGDINDFIFKPFNDLISEVNDGISDILNCTNISFKEIFDYLSNYGTSEDINLDDVEIYDFGLVNSPYPVYYGNISATLIGEWYEKYSTRLFSQNIRFYKGDTEVNEGIRKVLTNEPENFLYYNNGIKVLCKNIIKKIRNSSTNEVGIFTLKGASLINGAQTTGCIGKVYLENQLKLNDAKVMIQIIVTSEMTRDVCEKITKLSNTQNRIENKDFAAQDPNQERMKRELSFYHYQYLYKSGEILSDSKNQILFDEAIVGLACLYNDVSYTSIAKSNVGALSENILKAPYKVLFNKETNSFELVNSVLIIRKIEQILQNKKKLHSSYKYATCVHGNRLIEHLILQVLKIKYKFSTEVLDTFSIDNELNCMIDNYIDKISKELETTYKDSYPANVFKNQKKNFYIEQKVKV